MNEISLNNRASRVDWKLASMTATMNEVKWTIKSFELYKSSDLD